MDVPNNLTSQHYKELKYIEEGPIAIVKKRWFCRSNEDLRHIIDLLGSAWIDDEKP